MQASSRVYTGYRCGSARRARYLFSVISQSSSWWSSSSFAIFAWDELNTVSCLFLSTFLTIGEGSESSELARIEEGEARSRRYSGRGNRRMARRGGLAWNENPRWLVLFC